MARNRDRLDTESYFSDGRDRERRSHRRRHKHRPDDSIERRERRERRRAEKARREAELDIDELRAARAEYYSRPEPGRRRGESRPMAQEIDLERARSSRSRRVDSGYASREPRRDGTKRRKRREQHDGGSEVYVYGRPGSRHVEEITVTRSPPRRRRRSDEGGSYRSRPSSRLVGSRFDDTKLSRSTSAREPTRVYMATRPSVRRSSTVRLASAPISRVPSLSPRTSNSAVSPQRRSTSLFATLFKPPPPRTSISVIQKEVPRVECIICMTDDLPANKTAKLGCGHRMCHSCLKRQFSLSVTDPQHMPPTCCDSEHIPLKYVERLFDDKFKKLWNQKYQEYTTSNRLYCPTKGCGEWIKPSRIRMDLTYGRKYARCGRCNTKVCVTCNGKFHTRRECPKDEETNRLVDLAKQKGWQRCYNCKAMVELKEGCNHMTCRCTAQFCMLCAARWKTCNCPWFNYTNLDDDDRLNDMRVPYGPPRQDVVEVIEIPTHAPAPIRRSVSTRTRGADRVTQERADEALAAALQAQLMLDGRTPTPSSGRSRRRTDADVQVYGLGNAGAHHLNESYTVRPLASTARTTTRQAQAPARSPPRVVRHRTFRDFLRPQPPPPRGPVAPASASVQAGLSRDGRKTGMGRVNTWLQHVELDPAEVEGRGTGRVVEVDEWGGDRSIVGID